MAIYTRTGDKGETGLFGGARVPKGHPRVAAYGGVDEMNAVLGLLLANHPDLVEAELLRGIQNDLFDLGAARNRRIGGEDQRRQLAVQRGGLREIMGGKLMREITLQ